MTAKSHWHHLKHAYLSFMHHPGLNQTVYTMLNDVIPVEKIKADPLDGAEFISQPPPNNVSETGKESLV